MKPIHVMSATVATAAALAGCGGGSSGGAAPKAQPTVTITRPAEICVQALDQADNGFTQLAGVIDQVRRAFDVGMAGDPQRARRMLAKISLPDSSIYKQLEQQCRTAH